MEIVNVEKYYDKIKERFPELTEKQIDRIVKYGLRSFYNHNLFGGDVLLKSPYFTLYSGKMFKDTIWFYKYWKLKSKIKLRIKYKRSKTQYDGYYYFGLNEEDYQNLSSDIKSKRKKKVTFTNIHIFKILEECALDRNKKYFFKLAYPEDLGFFYTLKSHETRNFEYIGKRNKDNTISYENRNK